MNERDREPQRAVVRRSEALQAEGAGLELLGWLVAACGLGIALVVYLSTPVGPVGALLVVPFVSAGARVRRQGKRRTTRTAAEVLETDHRAPVLYLRSFSADRSGEAVPFEGMHTQEELLATALGALGPVVGVGRPGEQLPELGAARLYVSDDEWQRKVAELMDKAVLVAFRAGESGGLWWEIERATKRVEPERVLFLLGDLEEYDQFRRRLQHVLRRPLPNLAPVLVNGDPVDPERWIKTALYFDAGWDPRLLIFPAKGKQTRVFTARLEPVYELPLKLQPVLKSLGASPPRRQRSIRRRVSRWYAHGLTTGV